MYLYHYIYFIFLFLLKPIKARFTARSSGTFFALALFLNRPNIVV